MDGYRVIRSARRTLSLQVTREGEVVVRAPRNCSRGWIEGFVESHREWIARRQQLLRQHTAQREAFRLHTGDKIMLCGREITVELRPGSVPALSGDRLILPVAGIVLNRFTISMIAYNYDLPASDRYFPNLPEIMVSVFVVTMIVTAYRFICYHMPILYEHPDFKEHD